MFVCGLEVKGSLSVTTSVGVSLYPAWVSKRSRGTGPGLVSPWEGQVVWLEEAGGRVCVWVPRGVCKGCPMSPGACVSVSWVGSSPRAGIPVSFAALPAAAHSKHSINTCQMNKCLRVRAFTLQNGLRGKGARTAIQTAPDPAGRATHLAPAPPGAPSPALHPQGPWG